MIHESSSVLSSPQTEGEMTAPFRIRLQTEDWGFIYITDVSVFSPADLTRLSVRAEVLLLRKRSC